MEHADHTYVCCGATDKPAGHGYVKSSICLEHACEARNQGGVPDISRARVTKRHATVIESSCTLEHGSHGDDFAGVPCADILVEGGCTLEHRCCRDVCGGRAQFPASHCHVEIHIVQEHIRKSGYKSGIPDISRPRVTERGTTVIEGCSSAEHRGHICSQVGVP